MKTKMLKTKILVAMLLFTLTMSAQRQERQERKEPPTFKELLKQMDANEDGKLSEKEIEGPLKSDFKKIDTNEDGYISEKEFKKAPKPKRRKK